MNGNNKYSLMDRLDKLVHHKKQRDVKQIISSLAHINKFKHTSSDAHDKDFVHLKIYKFLNKRFRIHSFKIIKTIDNIDKVEFQTGKDYLLYNCKISEKVHPNTTITFLMETPKLSDFDITYLHCFIYEAAITAYIQYVLFSLEDSSTFDPLTHLKTRQSFQEEIKTITPLVLREKMKIGVLVINIDRFRAVNDEHGTTFGDEFLKLYAKTIIDTIRTSDIAVRFSGGEFLVLLMNIIDDARTLQIADEIKEKLANTYLISENGDKFKKTVCIGVSMFPEDSPDIEECIQKSKLALSDAQDQGRNNVLRFELNDGEFELF